MISWYILGTLGIFLTLLVYHYTPWPTLYTTTTMNCLSKHISYDMNQLTSICAGQFFTDL